MDKKEILTELIRVVKDFENSNISPDNFQKPFFKITEKRMYPIKEHGIFKVKKRTITIIFEETILQ